MIRCGVLVFVLLSLALLGACRGTSDEQTPSPATLITATTAPADTTPIPTASATDSPDGSQPTRTPIPAPSGRLHERAMLIQSLPDVSLDVSLFYGERWMRVKHTVEVVNRTDEPWEEVVFNVPINYVPGSFHLDAVIVTVGDDEQTGTPGMAGQQTIMRLPLPHSAEHGETILVQMAYRVIIPPVAATDWPPHGTTGWTFNLIQAGEWYPALVPYVEGEGWYTWPYHPVGDPTVYPLANYRLTVRVDDPDVIVVSGGATGEPMQPGPSGDWNFAVDAARGIAFFASPDYAMVSGEANSIPIYSFFLPTHNVAGEAALNIAIQSYELYEDLYGPYPYPDLTVVENGFFGGMEYSSLISITDYAYATYQGLPPSILHSLVSHEVAHQWFYGAVGNDQANEAWLDEAIAFYSELIYFETYHPAFVDWWWNVRVDIYEPYGPVDATIYSYSVSANFITSMYGQAARFMRDLRVTMGDEAFFAFLRDYYATNVGRIVTGDDFKDAAREHTDEKLDELFSAYFAEP